MGTTVQILGTSKAYNPREREVCEAPHVFLGDETMFQEIHDKRLASGMSPQDILALIKKFKLEDITFYTSKGLTPNLNAGLWRPEAIKVNGDGMTAEMYSRKVGAMK